MARINTYPRVDYLRADDNMIVDGDEAGTRSLPMSETMSNMLDRMPGYRHRGMYYRGYKLGDKVEDYQKADINNANFTGMFLGDYWTIDGVEWEIVAMDYFAIGNDTHHVTNTHHVVVMPRTRLGGQQVHFDDTGTAFHGTSTLSKWLDEQPAPSTAFLKFNVFRGDGTSGDSTIETTGQSYFELPSSAMLGLGPSTGKFRRDTRIFDLWQSMPFDKAFAWTCDSSSAKVAIASAEFGGYTLIAKNDNGNAYPYALIG